MSSYTNTVTTRTAPMTRSQCAVLAVVSDNWATIDQIWKRGAVFVSHGRGEVRRVAYGTICAILAGLHQQGFVERRRQFARRWVYRRVSK